MAPAGAGQTQLCGDLVEASVEKRVEFVPAAWKPPDGARAERR